MTDNNDEKYKVKDLAEILKVSPKTIKNWEKKGYIPEARRNKWGWRVYNEEEKKLIIARVKEQNYFKNKK